MKFQLRLVAPMCLMIMLSRTSSAVTTTFPVWQDVSLVTNHSADEGSTDNQSTRTELLAGDIQPGGVIPTPPNRNGSRHNLFRFDVGSLPQDILVTAAKMTLHLREARGPAGVDQTFDVFRVRPGHGDWQEAATALGPVTWTNRRNFNETTFDLPRPWTKFGATDTTEDIFPGVLANASITQGQTGFVDFVFDVNAPDFQGMIEEWRDALEPNAGIMMMHRADTGVQIFFDSKEGAAANPLEIAAVLELQYTVVPEPSTLAASLLLVGLVPIRRRSRHSSRIDSGVNS